MAGTRGWRLQNIRNDAEEDYQRKMDKALARLEHEKIDKHSGKKGYLSGLISKIKKKIQGFHFSFLFSKHSKTGRFGQKQAQEKEDAIKELGDNTLKEAEYFDPMAQLEVSKPEDENSRKGVDSAFAERVQQQMELTRENDFEKDQFGAEEEYAAVLTAMKFRNEYREEGDEEKAGEEKAVSKSSRELYGYLHDATRAFKPDSGTENAELKEVVPDNFEVELAVTDVSDYYVELTKAKTEARKKKTMWGWTHMVHIDTEDEIIQKAMKQTQEYKEIVSEGRNNNPNYDPKSDPRIDDLYNEVKSVESNNAGHSSVKLIPKVKDKDKAVYSFGFVPLVNNVPIGSTTEGLVQNPDAAPEGRKQRYPVSYANFLKAAAKIRGIMGAPRSYNVLGYNCTSFAIEVANEAGLSIPEKDMGVDISTFTSKSQRIDMPAALSKYSKKENIRQKKEAEQRALRLNTLNLENNVYFMKKLEGVPQDGHKQIIDIVANQMKTALQKADAKTLKALGINAGDTQDIREQLIDHMATEQGLEQIISGLNIYIPQNKAAGVEKGKKSETTLFNMFMDSPIARELVDEGAPNARMNLKLVYDKFQFYILNQADIAGLRKLTGNMNGGEELRNQCLEYVLFNRQGFEQLLQTGIKILSEDSVKLRGKLDVQMNRQANLRQWGMKLSRNKGFTEIFGEQSYRPRIMMDEESTSAPDKFIDSLAEWLRTEFDEIDANMRIPETITTIEQLKDGLKMNISEEEKLKKFGAKNVKELITKVCSDPEMFRRIYGMMRAKQLEAGETA